MEQTIGKRIAENRKRLGLTQDALAEQLGVTAQAVSKWENDQSCPDITMLPKLAEIFGTTTDALLGIQTVHTAEVVTDTAEKEENSGNKWEVTWDAGKHGSVTLAILVLLVGALTMANEIFSWNVGFWSILWPSTLLVYGFSSLFKKFSFFSFGCGLFGCYFLIQNLGIWQLDLSSKLLFPAVILLFGLSLLVDALRKPNKPKFRISRNGVDLSGNGKNKKCEFNTDTHTFDCSLSFGEQDYYIDIPLLQSGDISCSFGELTVDLGGCEEVFQNCEIDASCSFGELTLLVPKRFRVEPDSSTAFANFEISGQPDPEPKGIIRLDASVSFGQIEVRYI